MEGGRAEKECHEGGKTDTKHGFIKGSGRGVARETKTGQRKESSGGWCREGGMKESNAGEQRRGEGKNGEG